MRAVSGWGAEVAAVSVLDLPDSRTRCFPAGVTVLR